MTFLNVISTGNVESSVSCSISCMHEYIELKLTSRDRGESVLASAESSPHCNYTQLVIASQLLRTWLWVRPFITPPPIGERSIVTSLSVCPCVCLCMCLSVRVSVLLWRHSDTLSTSGFMDDVIFAHKPRLLDVAAQLKRSVLWVLGLATNCAQ